MGTSEMILFPDKKYDVILADPPWAYNDKASAGKRGAVYKYPVMDIAAIKALPVQQIASENCALFLWVTNPFLKEAFEVMDAWGFDYVTKGFEWIKLNKRAVQIFRTIIKKELRANDGKIEYPDALMRHILQKIVFMGMGHTTRQNDEMCLYARKGNPKILDKGVRSVIVSERREHSRKPDEQYYRIERLLGTDMRRIELFARQAVDGWERWGLESPPEDTV